MKQIQVKEFGGPEKLTIQEVPTPQPAAGEVLIEVQAIGINLAETMQRPDKYVFPVAGRLISYGNASGGSTSVEAWVACRSRLQRGSDSPGWRPITGVLLKK